VPAPATPNAAATAGAVRVAAYARVDRPLDRLRYRQWTVLGVVGTDPPVAHRPRIRRRRVMPAL
jgi:hypothetical protein